MPFLESLDTDRLVILAAETRAEYHRLRDRFYQTSRGYYHQHTTSSYYKEEDLIQILENLSSIKQSYKELCDILKSRGMMYFGGQWTSNDSLYKKKEVLHSA